MNILFGFLFWSMMFPNNSGDFMPVVYLTFLNDMINVPRTNIAGGICCLLRRYALGVLRHVLGVLRASKCISF
jgi:hypothetical protein